jgi:ABC-type phosphate transport system substrate-binding protein
MLRQCSLLSSLLVLAVGLAVPEAISAANGEDLAVIVNPSITVNNLSAAELEAIFTSSKRTWTNGLSIGAFSYPVEQAIRRTFDSVVLRMSPEEIARFWIDQRVRGGAPPPRQVPDPSLTVRLVAKLPGSIAYVPESLVNPSVKVVARVRNGKVIGP